MKNKMLILIGIICCIFLVISIYFIVSNMLKIDNVYAGSNVANINNEIINSQSSYKIDEMGRTELVGLVSSIEEAKEVATQYGIDFVSFDTGVAVFATKEDINKVIARGKENGYVNLLPNYNRTIQKNN